ncbi:hypothetical protein GBAR_LOCUS9163, partial [Geodia barretti]
SFLSSSFLLPSLIHSGFSFSLSLTPFSPPPPFSSPTELLTNTGRKNQTSPINNPTNYGTDYKDIPRYSIAFTVATNTMFHDH